jgi:hypothetical protein
MPNAIMLIPAPSSYTGVSSVSPLQENILAGKYEANSLNTILQNCALT